MKIKQTVQQIVMGLVLIGALFVVAAPTTSAAECGGVQTSIVGCDQKGLCSQGEDAYEGSKPTKPEDASAYTTKYGHQYGQCKDGTVPSTDDLQSTGIWGILLLVINILTAGVGVLAVAGIVYGSVLYTSAGGSPEQVKKAMGIITNVVIGVLTYALMYALLNFLIPGGLFT